jgi:hypothetical protein
VFDESPAQVVSIFRDYYGPTMNAFTAAAAKGVVDRLQRQLEELFENQNTSADPGTTSIPATYLHVEVAV